MSKTLNSHISPAMTSLLVLALAAPSMFSANRYLGLVGVGGVITISSLSILLIMRTDWPYRYERTLVIITVATTALLFFVIFPIADSEEFASGGSDRDEAYDIAIKYLLAGEYPYGELTYLGGPITPLPGGFLLALPSYLIFGTSSGMSLIWIPVAFAIMALSQKGTAGAVCFGVLPSLAYWQDVVQGGDLIATTFLAFAVASFAVRAIANSWATWIHYSLMVALGVVSTVRFTGLVFILAFALVASTIVGWRRSIALSGVSLLASTSLWLPFAVVNAKDFSPLHTSTFLGGIIGLGLVAALLCAISFWYVHHGGLLSPARDFAYLLVVSLFCISFIAATISLAFDGSIDEALWLLGYSVSGLLATVVVTNGYPHTESIP